MAPETIIPELTWICTLLLLVVFIMLLATCVCFKDHERSAEYGTAGRLSIARDSPVLHYQPRNGTLSSSSKQSDINSEDGNLKRNSWTVKDRALPEIPGSTFTPVIAHSSVTEGGGSLTAAVEHAKVKSHNKCQAPKPPGNDPSKVFPMNGSALLPVADGGSGVTVTITVNDKTQIIGNNSLSERTAKPRIPVVDLVPGTSNSMVVLKKVEKMENTDSPINQGSSSDANFYDIVSDSRSDKGSRSTSMSSSPVCIKVGNLSTTSEEGNASNLSASLAVAGAVPSSDIPYMTPPLLHNLPTSSVNEQTGNEVSSGRSEVPYTVISVREPLARVREITMRRQRASMQQRQRSSEENEDHYAMVPEEEQMYAEIGSGHDSGSSSITYAHIEPRELPPVPPTVESLKSVAHAHSRQASTVSTSSVGSCVSSTGEASPPMLRNPSAALYSTVEKNNKQRKTIHVAEGVSLVTTAEKRKKVEDLYAKVRKKRVELTIKTSGPDDYPEYQGIHGDNMECMTPPPSPWASTTPPAPPPITGRLQAASLSVLLPGNSQHVRRHSADPNLPEIINENRVFTGSTHSSLALSSKDTEEPDYEKIYNEENSGDSCYEKIKEDTNDVNSQTGYDIGKGWSDASGHCRMAPPSASTYPGYESVKDPNEDEDSLDPNYECVAQGNSENDPGYEPVRVSGNFDDSDSNSDYTVVKLDDCPESGYTRVKNLGRSESDAADPGYEKIKNVRQAGIDAADPGYERVRNKAEDAAEPGYETVQRSDSDTDPGYEVVHQSRSFNSRYAGSAERDSGDSRSVTHDVNSTILFVPGNSDLHSSNILSDQDQRPGLNDPSVTFL